MTVVTIVPVSCAAEVLLIRLDMLIPVLERHPRVSNAIHPFPPPLRSGNGWDGCKYVLSTSLHIFAVKNHVQ